MIHIKMFKLKDRKDSEFCLAPTHEEEITQLVASQVSSYRQLPLRLYQIGAWFTVSACSTRCNLVRVSFGIGKKFRDELRPRSGLLRGREFVMKDLYSFDATEEEAMKTYDEMRKAYARILDRIGVPYASVRYRICSVSNQLMRMQALADSGNIGGSKSHEYHLLSKGAFISAKLMSYI